MFEYIPDQASLLEVLTRTAARRVLLVGGDEIVNLPVDEVRHAVLPGPVLGNGIYALPRASGLDVIVCAGGTSPGVAMQADYDEVVEGHPLHSALGWFEHLWATARSIGDGPAYAVGDYVKLAGSESTARVEEVLRVDGTNAYRVTVDGQPRSVGEAGLLPLGLSSHDPSTWLRSGVATARELSVSLTVAKLTNPLTDTIYSYLSSKTVFRPYQFRPVLKLLSSPHQRLLIADEVGLGKTIEAGLIWTELEARNAGLNRVLIVCPAMLVEKWRSEMRRRFDRDLTVLDKTGLTSLVDLLKAGNTDRPLFGIVSLERLRSSDLLADLNEFQARFDLVIVDEAHYLRNRSTLSNELGQALSVWADVLVFLSATPLNLGNQDLFSLLNLLVEEEFADPAIFPAQVAPNRFLNAVGARLLDARDEPASLLPDLMRVHHCELGTTVTTRPEYTQLLHLLAPNEPLDWRQVTEAKRLLSELNTLSSVLTRTRKVDVPEDKAIRQPVQIDVDWTANERNLYDAVRAWALSRAKSLGHPPGFATQMPLRQAASCLPAVRQLLQEKEPGLFVATQTAFELDDFDDVAPELDDDVYRNGEANFDDIRRLLAPLGTVDTKFDRFVEKLDEARGWGDGQILVFSFFRRTIAYLEGRLLDRGWRVRSMHGGVPVGERQRIMDDFRAGKFDLLLTSEVGSEGLDFEFCNVVVNYDLPWNPMRVEQRIGRLDRFGQKHEKIFVINFHVEGTIETDIFERLYERINVFRESIGELEPILRDEMNELQRLVLDPNLSEDERARRLAEVSVATENQVRQIDEIREASSELAALDQLMIDGFEQDTTSRGRFVGPDELRILIEEFFADGTRAKLRRQAKYWTITGDEELADRVARWGGKGTASLYALAELAARLRDGDAIPVTFDNELASRNGIELISLRHPIVRAALRHFDARPAGFHQFGSVRLPSTGADTDDHLVVLYLAETTGLRPTLELWPIAADMRTGEVDEEKGFELLAALAGGNLQDGPTPSEPVVLSRLGAIGNYALSLQLRTDAERRQANESLVDARVATQRASFEHKIARAQATLTNVERTNRKESIQRLHRGHINNLRQRQTEAATALEAGRQLALTLRPIAAVVISS